jgi:prepilin-type processing-associated H-X9-DG protein
LRPELAGPIRLRTETGSSPLRWIDVTDGRQGTALFSEVLRGGPERLRTIWSLADGPFNSEELDVFVDIAKQLPKDPQTEKLVGHKSSKGRIIGLSLAPGNPVIYAQGPGRSLYNHAALPQTPSCHNGNKPAEAIVPPSSSHGVVNVAFCDGRVEPITPQIDLQIWRAQGSMSAND